MRKRLTKNWKRRVMRGCAKKTHKKRRRMRVSLKGGTSLIPSDITNAFNYSSYSAGSIYNGLLGFPPPVNPLPWSQ